MTKVEQWQSGQAWSTAADLLKRSIPEATLAELRADEQAALASRPESRRRTLAHPAARVAATLSSGR